ncbi:MAG: type II toxin-antitoxin system VapC family toxin [Methylococcaceae bacterium]|nr:type II toxin-antitoxin system VapC family toxin [Methylococcaceae bacterium]
MKLLLDTHVLLWYLDNNPKLPEIWKRSIEDRHNLVAVSIASLWEIAIKVSLGKLELLDSLTTIENILNQQGIAILPVRVSHLSNLLNLPFYHRDPFDRLIIAQAQLEQLTLVSDDGMFTGYSVSLLKK